MNMTFLDVIAIVLWPAYWIGMAMSCGMALAWAKRYWLWCDEMEELAKRKRQAEQDISIEDAMQRLEELGIW